MRGRHWPFAVFIGLVAGIQILACATGSPFYLTQLTMSAYYTLVAVGLCLLMGYAGQISMGHAGFFAIGGYVSAFLSTLNLLPMKGQLIFNLLHQCHLLVFAKDPYGASIAYLNPIVSCVVAIGAAALIAFLIGIPVLRLKGHYLAMATLGFGLIVYRIVLGTKAFGAADGISDIPAFRLWSVTIAGGSSFRILNYYFAWGLVVLCTLLVINLVSSRAGRALRAIHGNEQAAQAMGVDIAGFKLKLFVISAVFAAIAGVFLSHYNGGIGPSEAGIMKSVRYVSIVAVGGMANIWGTVFASAVLNFLSLRGVFGSYDDAVFGLILVSVMLFAPQGIVSRELFGWIGRLRMKKSGKVADAAAQR
jgi:branched-chain amino acid transport system permease protein